MNKLWIFGCSISDERQPKDREDYVKWKGYQIDTWSEILSRDINYKLENHAISGTNNPQIMENFSKCSNQIKENDIVIINWTETSRFRVAGDKWYNVLFQHIDHPDLIQELKNLNDLGMSTQTIKDTILNRTNHLFVDEVNNHYTLINEFCEMRKCKLFFWGMNIQSKYMLTYNGKNIYDYFIDTHGSIKSETNNLINDLHFSEQSHLMFAKHLLTLL
jgi:hypothetical protein